jgi:mannitol 2-dehydrogenase
MVDRITPVTTDEDRAQISERFAVEDAWPVVCEPFAQWALEDKFSLGRPPFEDVGVQVVPDVMPYELMKLRLLNASHQALCYFGYLAGYRLVHEVAQDQLFANFLLDYMNREATPTLAPVPGIDLDAYKLQLIERFSNAAVRDTVARLCARSSERIPTWLVPVIRENLAAGRDVTLSAAVVASWARYAEGVDEQGEPIEIVDELADTVQRLAAQQRDDPLAFVKNRELFGDLAAEPDFTEPYLNALNSLHSKGSRATLEALATRSTTV